MGRIWFLTALIYGYGHPGFDGHRPASLDQPLREFHRAVDATAINTRRALVTLDDNARNIVRVTDNLRHLSDVF